MRTLTVNDPVIKNDGKLTKLGSLGGGGGEPPAELGGLKFRESDEGKAQYKLPDSDEWVNFSEGGGSPRLVWENENPTNFNPQTINFIAEENYLIIEFRVLGSDNNYYSILCPNSSGRLQRAWYNTSYSNIAVLRQYTIQNGAITFGEGGYTNSSMGSYNVRNDYAIPTKIYAVNLPI